MAKKKQFDEVAIFFEYNIDLATRTIYIGSEEVNEGDESGVDTKLAEKAIKGLRILDSQHPNGDSPITVVLSGYGGDYYFATAIFDAIKQCRNEVVAISYGPIMSAHSIIFQAANRRIMSSKSKQMIHTGEFYYGGHTKVFESWAKESKKLDLEMEQIYLERIREKHPNYKLSELRKLLSFDTILNANEAVELGLADQVI